MTKIQSEKALSLVVVRREASRIAHSRAQHVQAAAMWTAPPSVLCERYGVTARQVFGASSPRFKNHSSSLSDLPPLFSSRTVGTQSLSSFEGIQDIAPETDPLGLNSDRRSNGSSTGGSPHTGSPVRHALSLGELRKIVLGSGPPKVRLSPADDSQRGLKSGRGLAASDVSLRSRRQRDGHNTGVSESLASPKAARPISAQSGVPKLSNERPLSSASNRDSLLQRLSAVKTPGEQESEDGESESEAYDSESESEDMNEQSWGGGVGGRGDPLGLSRHQARKKKEANPFKVYEDREQRLQLERHWLMSSDNSNRSYLATRMRDMKKDAVASRRTREDMSTTELYEDTVYFGQYSTELKALLKKKEEDRKSKRKAHILKIGHKDIQRLVHANKDTVSKEAFDFEALEAHEHAKSRRAAEKQSTKHHRGDKHAPCQDVMTLQRLQAVLQESGHRVERAHDMVP